jgi:RHH-type proline utilization regulon transcriptional repressor/proline dehydrogenase/delta 1-pyrroline-5-carboxylate dehydrogenase
MTQPLSIVACRSEMVRLHRAPERQVLLGLLDYASVNPAERARIEARARDLVREVRAGQASGWVNRFLGEYRLDTDEGLALLALAEAYMRIPDAATADWLIRDKIGGADWSAHSGDSGSAIVNAATLGLAMTRTVLSGAQGGALRRLVARAGEPFVRTAVGGAMRLMGETFVMGRTIEEALARASHRANRGFTASFDMLGEAARTHADADRYFASYQHAITATGGAQGAGHSVSVKLSALHPRYETAQAARCVPDLVERLGLLARQAAGLGVDLTVDAEEADRLELSLDIIEAVARDRALAGWEGFGLAVQAYGKRARPLIGWADALAAATGRTLFVRLVKGAYWDGEIKRAQVEGLQDYPVFTRKAATDVSYLACARQMLASGHLRPAFATHNTLTVATLLEWAGNRRDFEFQRLHGMGEGLYERLVREHGYRCRTYAPVGGHHDLLAYLVRRLLENGANSSFVHQLANPEVTDDELLADPAEQIRAVGASPHPAIPAPSDIFPGRRNSQGLDLADAATLARLEQEIARWAERGWSAAPLVSGQSQAGDPRAVLNPASPAKAVGQVVEATPAMAAAAIAAARQAASPWNAQAVAKRAQCLERLADSLEEHRVELLALAVLEAGKTLGDALAEVREAVDFCRYYAQQAREQFVPQALPGPTGEYNELRLEGRGVFACIAPWNFPLAIFLGQVAAALVAGNAVIAKPAPQTPLIAFRAVQLAHQAGIPAEVLQFLPGGPAVGEAITADPAVRGVAFTGSTGTAVSIARALLGDGTRGIVPLIAETGGLNAMIVDSTALPEQVVADVLASAFRSAGQRCSALRLLMLQEDVAPRVIAMLRGAMDTLVLGDPAMAVTDVGPVIDQAAHAKLEDYRQAMRGQWLHSLERPAGDGLFLPPTLIALERGEDLKEEWFGPILHVATWRADELGEIIERINASGFGLTMGVHSRIGEVAEKVQARARVGNLYVNRSIIGAVVGSQPFGGEGLSGTGPKAGGPRYLARFATERAVSIDTTSAGGNASLLSLAG